MRTGRIFCHTSRPNRRMILRKKLTHPHTWRKIFFERLTEPVHLNALSVLVGVFGSFRQKAACDLLVRPYHAFALLKAADWARTYGLPAISVIEFGVAAGTGLMNIAILARKVTSITGVDIQVYGFDGGKGMPPHCDYRDHPDLYREGDFPTDLAALKSALPANAHLIIGELGTTVPEFVKSTLAEQRPLGYVTVDVDYYSSTVKALKVLDGPARCYLPMVNVYLDDVHFEAHNPFAGELLAVNEFNQQHQFRKICRHEFLECSRIFRRAAWLKHMFILQVMDHPARQNAANRPTQVLENPYL
jgi:hypothetical protein